MGEAADDILDGSCCQDCGEWFHDGKPPGHPRSCCAVTPARTNKNRRKRERHKRRRAAALSAADTTGWTPLTQYHFRRMIGTEALDWWPSTGKYYWRNTVVGADVAEKLLRRASK